MLLFYVFSQLSDCFVQEAPYVLDSFLVLLLLMIYWKTQENLPQYVLAIATLKIGFYFDHTESMNSFYYTSYQADQILWEHQTMIALQEYKLVFVILFMSAIIYQTKEILLEHVYMCLILVYLSIE